MTTLSALGNCIGLFAGLLSVLGAVCAINRFEMPRAMSDDKSARAHDFGAIMVLDWYGDTWEGV